MKPGGGDPAGSLAFLAAGGHIGAMAEADDTKAISVDGNRLTVIADGPARMKALLGLIDGAMATLRLLYYTYTGDKSGGLVRDALLRAQTRGVKVWLLVDGFGSGHTPEAYFKPLRDGGAKMCRFNPAYGRRYMLRNHQKLALADDKHILIGGFNIEDDYFGTEADGAWRDIGLLLEGEAAARVAPYYDALMAWSLNQRSRLKDLRAAVNRFSERKGPLQWQYGGPMQLRSPWAMSTVQDLAACKSLDMIAAYFAPLGGMLKRIAMVSARGSVRIITAAKSDNRATIDAARSTYSRLMRRGVTIYEYQPAKLHSKLLVMDDVVHIGSSNFDLRSLYLNMEMMLRVDDRAFARLMRRYFEGEVSDSVEITETLHHKRGHWLERLRWKLGWFLVTSLDYTVTRNLALRAR